MKRILWGMALLALILASCARSKPGRISKVVGTPDSTAAPQQKLSGDMDLLLLGIDRRAQSKDVGWRTDTIIVVAIRPQRGLVAMFSIPRDLWVTIPGHGEERINAADYLGESQDGPGGGPRLLAATLEQNLGIHTDAYARINFQGLERIIDTLGGINVTADRAFDEWTDNGESDENNMHLQIHPGPQHMDGQTALAYARSRRDTNDMDRARRQQQVLLAMREAAMRPQVLPRLPSLLNQLSDTVETDLNSAEVMSLLNLGLRLPHDAFRGRVFDYSMVRDWTTPDSAMVLLPNRPQIQQAWAELTGDAPAGY